MSNARVKGRRSPCQGCGERFIGCHAVCQSYIDFSNSRKEENRKSGSAINKDLHLLNQDHMRHSIYTMSFFICIKCIKIV